MLLRFAAIVPRRLSDRRGLSISCVSQGRTHKSMSEDRGSGFITRSYSYFNHSNPCRSRSYSTNPVYSCGGVCSFSLKTQSVGL